MASFTTRSPFSMISNTSRRPIVTPFALLSGSVMSTHREEPRNDIPTDVGSSYSQDPPHPEDASITEPPPLEEVFIDNRSPSAAPLDSRSVTSFIQPSNVTEHIHRNLLKETTFPGPHYTAITLLGYTDPAVYAIIDLELLSNEPSPVNTIVHPTTIQPTRILLPSSP